MRPSLSIPALLLGAATSTLAQGFFGLYAPPVQATTPSETATELPTPFVPGRDNLAFDNPAGVVTVGGYRGNCYTMAWTAKLFREAARYQPGDRGTLDLDAVADALERSPYPGAGFPVPGSASLHEFSGTEEGRVALDPLIATVHYMHYLQLQLPDLARAVGADEEGSTRATRTALEEAKHLVAADTTPLVVLWNPDPAVTYGHVVLAYRVVEVRDAAGDLAHTDLYVYDSNIQHGAVRDETIVRVDAETWRYDLLRRDAASGEVVADDRYDGADWFAGEHNQLLLLDDHLSRASERKALAEKLRTGEEQTEYMKAGDRFLDRLTEVSPDRSPLQDDLRALLLDLQEARRAFGETLRPELSRNADSAEMDSFLQTAGTRAVLHAAPFLLPSGVGLEQVAIETAGQPRNSVLIHVSVVLEPGGTVDAVVEALAESALLRGSEEVRTQLREARGMLGHARITVDLSIRVEKGTSPDPRIGKWAPLATIEGSRIRLGDLSRQYVPPGHGVLATSRAWYAPARRHQLHVSEEVLDQMVRTLLKRQDVLGKPWTETLDAGIGQRDVEVTLDDIEVSCTSSYVSVDLELHGFAGVTGQRRGYVFDTSQGRHKVTLPFSMGVEDSGLLRVSAGPWGRVDVDDGLGGASNGLAAFAAEAAFPALAGYLEDTLTGELGAVVALAPGESVAIERVNLRTAKGTEVAISASMPSVRLDPAATAKRLGGGNVPLVLDSVESFPDRLVVTFRGR